MNIFFLDKSPKIAAQMMCNKHVVKMIVESAQMLSTAHRVCDGDDYANEMGLYKLAHKNHPSTKWVRSNPFHYLWLYHHMIGLMDEYTHRYGKVHATERLKSSLKPVPKQMLENTFTDFIDPPQCMPEECKQDDTVFAYQTYYIVEKSRFAKWIKREIPKWFIGGSDGKRESVKLGA
jgi:hypothetical protein